MFSPFSTMSSIGMQLRHRVVQTTMTAPMEPASKRSNAPRRPTVTPDAAATQTLLGALQQMPREVEIVDNDGMQLFKHPEHQENIDDLLEQGMEYFHEHVAEEEVAKELAEIIPDSPTLEPTSHSDSMPTAPFFNLDDVALEMHLDDVFFSPIVIAPAEVGAESNLDDKCSCPITSAPCAIPNFRYIGDESENRCFRMYGTEDEVFPRLRPQVGVGSSNYDEPSTLVGYKRPREEEDELDLAMQTIAEQPLVNLQNGEGVVPTAAAVPVVNNRNVAQRRPRAARVRRDRRDRRRR